MVALDLAPVSGQTWWRSGQEADFGAEPVYYPANVGTSSAHLCPGVGHPWHHTAVLCFLQLNDRLHDLNRREFGRLDSEQVKMKKRWQEFLVQSGSP